MQRLRRGGFGAWENKSRLRSEVVRLPFVKQVVNAEPKQNNRNSDDSDLDGIPQDLAPLKLQGARILQNCGLQDEELQGHEHQQDHGEGDLPESRFTNRNEAIKTGE